MKKDILGLKSSLSFTTILFVLLSVVSCNQQSIRYYKAETLFQEFKMASEYHEDINAYQQAFDLKITNLNSQLDSLKYQFKAETNEESKKLLYFKISDFQKSIDKTIENGGAVLQQKIEQGDTEIWSRINNYLTEYCKAENIDLLIDVGNVVATPYYNKEHDITEACANYINVKYDAILKD